MRLPEQMEEAGYFWLPDKIEKKLPGTLRITDTGKITLEVLGLFGDLVDELNNRQVNLKRIVGVIEEGRFVTLDRCR